MAAMKRFFLLFCLLLIVQGHLRATAQTSITEFPDPDPSEGTYSMQAFIEELQKVSHLLGQNPTPKELGALRDSLPKQWTVRTANKTYSVSADFLDKELAAGASGIAKIRVDHLLAQVQSYSAPRTAIAGNARSELDKILAGSEFGSVRPPSRWELLRERVAAWIGQMLYKLFGGLERYPIGGQILFWVVVVACVGFIALWLFRFMVSRDRMDALPTNESVTATRTWQEWIRAAREAANRNDFREAVHSAYWAGIVRLEDTGVVPKDRTKTPREYLRLLSEPSPHELALRPIYREPLAELTKRLERIWYANRGAGPEDFRDSLRQLEAMGCPLE